MTTGQLTFPVSSYVAVAFDCINKFVKDLPRDAFAVGGYVNGAYAWAQTDWGLFPHAYHIRINVLGTPGHGNALDVERGDATPADVTQWINGTAPKTRDPLLIYCNRSNLDACVAARNNADYWAWIWVATLDETLITDRAMVQIDQIRENGVAVADQSLILRHRLRAEMIDRIGVQTV